MAHDIIHRARRGLRSTNLRGVAIAGLAGVLASGCIIIADNDSDGRGDGYYRDNDRKETFYAVSIESAGVRVQAPSNGCTDESSFRTDVDERGDRYRVTFYRVQEDYCRANVPEGVELFFPRSNLGLPQDAPIYVTNAAGR